MGNCFAEEILLLSLIHISISPLDISQVVTLAKTPHRAAKGKSVMKAHVMKVNLCNSTEILSLTIMVFVMFL